MIYEYRCLNGHCEDHFHHAPEDKGCPTYICQQCRNTMGPVVSYGRGLTYFEEGRGQWIHNMGHDPVYIRSHSEHQRIMKERGLEWVTPKRGEKGCWT